MDNRYFDSVLKEMNPFFEEHGFKPLEDGIYKNEKMAVKIEYNDERQMYLLKTAQVQEDAPLEFAEASAWLFDDTQNAKDAESVGIDFTSTLRDSLGIKHKRSSSAAPVDLPSSTNGNYNISALTKKVLDVFPQFKDAYKEHVSKYGNFLYLNFFAQTFIPQIKTVLTENNKKAVKKLRDMLENGYLQGDAPTVNVIVACVAAACVGDTTVKENAFEMLKENAHFKNAVAEFIPVIEGNKKLKSTLIK